MTETHEVYAELIEIREEPTALYKILKIANAVSGGGEAKLAISEGYVFLNGEVETQKRKKIMAGDVIFFNDQYFQIALKGETDNLTSSELPQEYEAVKAPPKKNKARPPISF